MTCHCFLALLHIIFNIAYAAYHHFHLSLKPIILIFLSKFRQSFICRNSSLLIVWLSDCCWIFASWCRSILHWGTPTSIWSTASWGKWYDAVDRHLLLYHFHSAVCRRPWLASCTVYTCMVHLLTNNFWINHTLLFNTSHLPALTALSFIRLAPFGISQFSLLRKFYIEFLEDRFIHMPVCPIGSKYGTHPVVIVATTMTKIANETVYGFWWKTNSQINEPSCFPFMSASCVTIHDTVGDCNNNGKRIIRPFANRHETLSWKNNSVTIQRRLYVLKMNLFDSGYTSKSICLYIQLGRRRLHSCQHQLCKSSSLYAAKPTNQTVQAIWILRLLIWEKAHSFMCIKHSLNKYKPYQCLIEWMVDWLSKLIHCNVASWTVEYFRRRMW